MNARDRNTAARAADHATSEDAVVTKALLRAASALGLSQKDLARAVGVSEATMSRMSAGGVVGQSPTWISVARKEGELALLFLRVYRSLDALVGGDASKLRAWFWAENVHVGGIPKERVQSVEGLAGVASYLDAMRGKL